MMRICDRRKIDLVRETLTRGLGVGLSYREFAHDFKHQVPAFVTYVSCVKQILKLGIQFEPSVSVTIGFMADSISFRTFRGVNHRDSFGSRAFPADATGSRRGAVFWPRIGRPHTNEP